MNTVISGIHIGSVKHYGIFLLSVYSTIIHFFISVTSYCATHSNNTCIISCGRHLVISVLYSITIIVPWVLKYSDKYFVSALSFITPFPYIVCRCKGTQSSSLKLFCMASMYIHNACIFVVSLPTFSFSPANKWTTWMSTIRANIMPFVWNVCSSSINEYPFNEKNLHILM